jgi:hypothetical protein
MLISEMKLGWMRYLISYEVAQSRRKPEEVSQATTGAPSYRQQSVACPTRPPSSIPLAYHLQSPPSQNPRFTSNDHILGPPLVLEKGTNAEDFSADGFDKFSRSMARFESQFTTPSFNQLMPATAKGVHVGVAWSHFVARVHNAIIQILHGRWSTLVALAEAAGPPTFQAVRMRLP